MKRPSGVAGVTVMGVTQFERFFRRTASLDVDKQDLKRYSNFINHKIYDLLVRGQAVAGANHRDIIEPHDLPITPGLQKDIYAFSKLDELIGLHSVLEHIAGCPPLDRALSDATESCLPRIAGGLSVALARSFKVIDPNTKNPATREWERAFQLFNLLL